MIVFIPKEKLPNETRVSATPNTVNDLIKAGLQVHIESNAGLKSFITDQDYESKGGVIIKNPSKSYAQADIVLKVIAPSVEEIKEMKSDSCVISFCQTTRELEYVKGIQEKSITIFQVWGAQKRHRGDPPAGSLAISGNCDIWKNCDFRISGFFVKKSGKSGKWVFWTPGTKIRI